MIKSAYEKLGSFRIIVIFGVIYLISQISIGIILHPLGIENVLTFQTTFSMQVFSEILEKWGPAGIEQFKKHFYLDFIHPFFYGILLAALISLLTRRKDRAPSGYHIFLFLLPFISSISDSIENIIHVILLSDIQNLSPTLITVSAVFCNLKWLIVMISILVAGFYIGKKIILPLRSIDAKGK